MEHVVAVAGRRHRAARRGRRRRRGASRAARCVFVEEADVGATASAVAERSVDLDAIRPDLAEVLAPAGASRTTRPARRGRAPAHDRPAHGARERRRPVRPGLVRRVRRAGDRRAAPPAHARRPDRAHARPTAWSPASAGSTATLFGARARALRRDGLRLHRARRHAGAAEPPQEGPHVRAGGAVAAAGRALRRGRRRPARRHRRAPAVAGLDTHGLPPLRAAERAGAARRHRLGPLLRRQRGAARLLRRRHRHRGTPTSAWAARR